jgi:hypothetical protein
MKIRIITVERENGSGGAAIAERLQPVSSSGLPRDLNVQRVSPRDSERRSPVRLLSLPLLRPPCDSGPAPVPWLEPARLDGGLSNDVFDL